MNSQPEIVGALDVALWLSVVGLAALLLLRACFS